MEPHRKVNRVKYTKTEGRDRPEAAWACFHSGPSTLEGTGMSHSHSTWALALEVLPEVPEGDSCLPPYPVKQVWLPHTYLSYLLCRSFSICGRTVVHRSSFHRELGRGPGTCSLSTWPRMFCPLPPLQPLTLSG